MLRRLLHEIKYGVFQDIPTSVENPHENTVCRIYTDNTQVISAIKEGATARTKHYDIHWKLFQKLSATYRVMDIPSEENVADLLTKCLTMPRITYLQKKIHQM